MQNLPLDTESKILAVAVVLFIIGIILLACKFAKWMHNYVMNLPPYTKQDHKREIKTNKFKSIGREKK